MTKRKKLIWAIVSVVLAVCLVVLAVVLGTRSNQSASTVMECSINPDIQFVLDNDNKVMTVNCLNSDAEVLIQAENFEGLSAEDAAKLLTQLATETGYISVETTGSKVTITFYTEQDKNIDSLKKEVVDSVNAYFDENGIIAGAVANQVESFEQVLSKIGADVSNYADMTTEEILKYVDEKTRDVEGVATSYYTQITTKIEELKTKLDFSKYETAIETYKKQIEEYQAEIDKYSKQLQELQNSGLVTEETLKPVQTLLDEAQSNLDEAKQMLSDAQAKLKELETKLDTELDTFLTELKEQSKQVYETAKQTLQDKLSEFKAKVAERKAYFEEHKDDIQAKINEYRTQLA